jgi:large subunit ribosomal protein L3
MGAALRKARNLDVVRIDEADNLLLVKGSVPGANGGYLYIQESL